MDIESLHLKSINNCYNEVWSKYKTTFLKADQCKRGGTDISCVSIPVASAFCSAIFNCSHNVIILANSGNFILEILLSETKQYCLIFLSLLKYSAQVKVIVFVTDTGLLIAKINDLWK